MFVCLYCMLGVWYVCVWWLVVGFDGVVCDYCVFGEDCYYVVYEVVNYVVIVVVLMCVYFNVFLWCVWFLLVRIGMLVEC